MLARPKRFELLTPIFVVWNHTFELGQNAKNSTGANGFAVLPIADILDEFTVRLPGDTARPLAFHNQHGGNSIWRLLVTRYPGS